MVETGNLFQGSEDGFGINPSPGKKLGICTKLIAENETHLGLTVKTEFELNQ